MNGLPFFEYYQLSNGVSNAKGRIIGQYLFISIIYPICIVEWVCDVALDPGEYAFAFPNPLKLRIRGLGECVEKECYNARDSNYSHHMRRRQIFDEQASCHRQIYLVKLLSAVVVEIRLEEVTLG